MTIGYIICIIYMLHNQWYTSAAAAKGGNNVAKIDIKPNESLDSALRRFKRSCAKDGTLAELRKKEYYQSPSVKRRKKSEAARKNKNKRYY